MIMMIEVCKQLMDVDNEGLKRYVVDNNMVFLGLAEEFSWRLSWENNGSSFPLPVAT